MKFGTYLLGLVQPLLGRVLVALGFSVVTIVGLEVAVNQVKSLIINNLGAAGGLLDFALYLWIGKGLGIVFGAVATKLALWQIERATSIVGKGNG